MLSTRVHLPTSVSPTRRIAKGTSIAQRSSSNEAACIVPMNATSPRKARSFRANLLLAMMLVVSAITTAVLYFAQRNAESDVQRTLQREFQDEFGALIEVQEAHRAAIAERCRALAKSVRIRASLEESDVEDLYLNAAVELRGMMEGDGGPGSTRAKFFRFLDAHGAVMSPSRKNDSSELWDSQLVMTSVPETQQVGYVAGQAGEIHEVIATPIVTTDTGEIIGAIVLGFEPIELGTGKIVSGIWLKGQLYPPSLGSEVARALAVSSPGENHLPVNVRGGPHLLFYKELNPDSDVPLPGDEGFGRHPHGRERARRWTPRRYGLRAVARAHATDRDGHPQGTSGLARTRGDAQGRDRARRVDDGHRRVRGHGTCDGTARGRLRHAGTGRRCLAGGALGRRRRGLGTRPARRAPGDVGRGRGLLSALARDAQPIRRPRVLGDKARRDRRQRDARRDHRRRRPRAGATGRALRRRGAGRSSAGAPPAGAPALGVRERGDDAAYGRRQPAPGPRNIARFCDNLRRARAGEPLVGVVDKQLGY